MTDAEKKLARLMKANTERVRKYRQTHSLRHFSVTLSSEKFDLLDKRLKEKGITKVQFVENAIDRLLEE